MSTYQLNIDATSAEAGAERIVKSFDSIRAAATRMEGGIVASANKMVNAFRQLSGIKTVGREAVERLESLSRAMGGFRGPAKASVQNTVDLLNGLSKFSGLRLPGTAQLGAFLAATSKYSGPTPQAGKNLSSLVNALNKFNGVAGAGSRVTAFLNALGSYRGPSANAGKNVNSLFSALSNFKGLPKGFASSSEAFIRFAAAVDKAASSMRNLRSVSDFKVAAPSARGVGGGGSGGGAAGVRMLAREYSFLETAILRTHTAMNALGGVLAARSIINASNDVLKIRAQLVAATGSVYQAATQFKYLQAISQELGLDFRTTAQSYGKFLGSVKGTKTDILQAQQIFEGFATAGRALQLSTDDMDGIFRALGQIMSKGKLQAEELRGQLGDRLPGAFSRMAAALGISTTELDAQMKKGLISGQRLQDGLLNMADMLKVEFSKSAEQASKTVDAAFNRMNNAFVMAASGLGKSGMNEGLISIADAITKIVKSDALATFLQGLGMLFKVVGNNANLFLSLGLSALTAWTLKAAVASEGLKKLQAGFKDFGNTASSAFNQGYQRGTGLVTGAPAAASGTAAAGAAASAAAPGMDAYASATQRASAANTSEAASAQQAAANTAVAGDSALASSGKFDAQASAAARSAGSLGVMGKAAVDTATHVKTTSGSFTLASGQAQNFANSLNTVARSSGTTSASFGAVTSAVAAQGGALAGAANSSASYGASLLRLSANSSVAGQAIGGVTTSVANAAPFFGGAATNIGKFAGAAATATGAAESLAAGTLTAGAGATGAAVQTGVLTGSLNGLGVQGGITSKVLTGVAVAEGQAAGGAVAQTLATRVLAGAAGYAAGAFNVLKVAMLTLPLVGLTLAITGLVMWISNMKSASEEAEAGFDRMNGSQSAGQQINADYADYVMNTTNKLDAQSEALRRNTLRQVENNLAKAGDLKVPELVGRTVKAGENVVPNALPGVGGMYGAGNAMKIERYKRGGQVVEVGGEKLPSDVVNGLLSLGSFSGGKFSVKAPKSAAEFEKARRVNAAIQLYADTSGNEDVALALTDAVSKSTKVLDSQSKAKRLGSDKIGFDPSAIDAKLQAELRPKPFSSSVDPAGAGKKTKTPKGPDIAGQDGADLRRALEGVRDLNREIYATDRAISEVSATGGSAVASAAADAAKAQLDNVEDAYNTVERAQKGMITFTSSLKQQASEIIKAQATIDMAANNPASVDADKLEAAKRLMDGVSQTQIDAAEKLSNANTQGYAASRAAAEEYLTTLQRLKLERQKELDLSKQIAEGEAELATRTAKPIPNTGVNGVLRSGVDMVEAARQGGRALEEATIRQAALSEALGVSAEKYDEFVARLIKYKTAQAEANKQTEAAAKLHAQDLERASLQDTVRLYSAGGDQRQIENQLGINALQREMINNNWDAESINRIIAQEKELIRLRDRVEEVKDSYAKWQQLSQDVSDTIVDGFRDAIDGTKSFGAAMKDVFSQIKRIILDTFVFNPIKKWLESVLQGAAQPAAYTAPGSSSAANSIVTQAAPQAAGAATLFSVAGELLGGGASSSTVARASTANDGWSGPAGNNSSAAATAAFPGSNQGKFSVTMPKDAQIVVNGAGAKQGLASTLLDASKRDFFEPIKQLFTKKWEVKDANGAAKMVNGFGAIKDGFKDIGSAFGSSVKGVGNKLTALGKGLGKVASVAGQAFAAFSVGQTIGKALGLGKTGGNILGGAAAGFTVAGPIGAAVGAVAGLVGSIFGSRKKPQARADLLVASAGGPTSTGNTYVKDKGDLKGTLEVANQAGAVFQRVAEGLDAYLTAGNYGTFGMSKKIKGDVKTFYSTTGKVDKKGRPVGVIGQDFIIGSPDELAAFAIKKQIQAGKFGDLDPIYKKIAQNTKATTTDALSADLNVGKQYLDFVEQAKGLTDVEKSARDLEKTYKTLTRSSQALGLSTNLLNKAYEKMKVRQKSEFDFSINQGILGIKDPIMAEYNQLVKDYTSAVRSANAVGGDLTKVEEYFGLQRAELIKKYMQQANNGIKAAADDLLRQLTATDSSPLSAQTVFANAQDRYNALKEQLAGGDYTNVDKLGQYSQDYLAAAQSLFSSSADFFQVFNQVTDFLKYVGAAAPAEGTTDPNSLPTLPALQTIQEQIASSNADLIETTQDVGAAITEGNATLRDILEQLRKYGYASGLFGMKIDPALLPSGTNINTLV